MIPPHLFYQIYLSFLEQNDCTPPKCGELSEYTDSAHTEVEDLYSRCMNGSNVYDRCGYDTRHFLKALLSIFLVIWFLYFISNGNQCRPGWKKTVNSVALRIYSHIIYNYMTLDIW